MGSGSSKSKKEKKGKKVEAKEEPVAKDATPEPEPTTTSNTATDETEGAPPPFAEPPGDSDQGPLPPLDKEPSSLPPLDTAESKPAPKDEDGVKSDTEDVATGEDPDEFGYNDIPDDDGDSDSGTDAAIEDFQTKKEARSSVGVNFSKARPTTATGHQIKNLDDDEKNAKLAQYSEYIWTKARGGREEDDVMLIDDFMLLVHSQTLGLSDFDKSELFGTFDIDHNGELTVEEFEPVMVDLMNRNARAKKETNPGDQAWEWFILYFDDDPESLPLYYNTTKRSITYEKPAGIEYKVKHEDTQEFQTLVNTNDEAESYISYVDETNVRWYMDPESGGWQEVPQSWAKDFEVQEDQHADALDFDDIEEEEEDMTVVQEKFCHHMTGQEYECEFTNGVRMMYDEESCDWINIPIAFEVYCPAVIRALYKIKCDLPAWDSINEKILALRLHKYNVDKTIAWKFFEMEHTDPTSPGLTSYDAKAALAVDESGVLPAGKNAISKEKLAELEKAVTDLEAAQKQVEELKAELQKAHDVAKGVEEKAKLAGLDAASSSSTVDELNKNVADLKKERAEQDEAITALKKEKADLEKQVQSFAAEKVAGDSSLQAQHEQLELRVKELTAQLQAASGEGGSLQESLTASETALKTAREELVQAKTELSAETIKATGFEKEVEGLNASVAELSAQKTMLEGKVEDLGTSSSDSKRQQDLGLKKLQLQVESTRSANDQLMDLVKNNVVPNMLDVFKTQAQTLEKQYTAVVEEATKDLLLKYRFEVRQRKLIYNKLQELKGNIRVFCRVRFDDRVNCVLTFPDEKGMGTPTEITCPNPRDPKEKKKFDFDRVFSPASTQQEVFDDTEPIMTSACDGYNVTIIAYGQTGSGKTFTMMGTPDNPGVNRRAVGELLRVCKERDAINYKLKVSLMEIYNDKFVDLLTELPVEQQECELRMDPKTKAGFVTNMTERPVASVDDVVKTLADGEVNRSVASTKMNSVSSRSHLLLVLHIEGEDTITGQISKGKLTMVDLAGSERISKTEATGQRLVEAAAINKSLSSLGQVFNALRKGDAHVPYRNSKLTHILQDSLGGDAKTCMFVNVSPAESNLAETLGTINFGSSIRQIELKGGAKKKKKEKK